MLGEFPVESEYERGLRKLAELYDENIEGYDRIVCTGRDERGTAMPSTVFERMKINYNQKRVYAAFLKKAQADFGCSEEVWRKAIRDVIARQRR